MYDTTIKDSALHKIITTNQVNDYISFQNSDYKKWIIPVKNAKTALNLYQPSALKGKLVKLTFPFLLHYKQVFRLLKVSPFTYGLSLDFIQYIENIIGTDQLEFSIFGGTPSVHQKITIQIFKGKAILGYCKISVSEDIKKIFSHEQRVLDFLHQQQITNTPRCLYCGDVNNSNLGLFVQSTIKSNGSKVIHKWKAYHWEFLKELQQKTKKEIVFENSDFFKSLHSLNNLLQYITPEQKPIVKKALDKVLSHYKNKEVSFNAIHRDFTPWNMFLEKGKLFVFDFEYARLSYPPLLDYFHFYTQTCIFERRWNAEQILAKFGKSILSLEEHFSDPVLSYQCYLLDIISLFLERDKGEPTADIKKNLDTWIQILNLL